MTKDDILELINIVSCITITVLLIVGGVGFIAYNFDKYTCEKKGEIYDIETEYNISGCYAVLPEGKMLIRNYEEQTQRIRNIYIQN